MKKQLQDFAINILAKIFAKLLENNNKVLLSEIKILIKEIQIQKNKPYSKDLDKILSSKVDQSLINSYTQRIEKEDKLDFDFSEQDLNSILSEHSKKPKLSAKQVQLSDNIDTLQSGSVLDADISFLKGLQRL